MLGAVLLVVANTFPIVGLEAQGTRTSATLFGSVHALYDDGMRSVAMLCFVTAILMPAIEVGAMLYILLPLRQRRTSRTYSALGWTPMKTAARPIPRFKSPLMCSASTQCWAKW
jgi:uncharacterized paraquat-inducible protein A